MNWYKRYKQHTRQSTTHKYDRDRQIEIDTASPTILYSKILKKLKKRFNFFNTDASEDRYHIYNKRI